MNIGRIIAAGVLGGIIMFGWGAVSHMATPIGEMGKHNLPAEEALLPALKTDIPKHGFYLFPGMDPKDRSDAAMKALCDKYKAGPHGVLVFNPVGSELMMSKLLTIECLSNILAALLAAVVIAGVRAPYLCRVMAAVAIGVTGWVSLDVSYWNWYDFPDQVILGSLIDQGVGWLLSGLCIAALVGGSKGPKPAAPPA